MFKPTLTFSFKICSSLALLLLLSSQSAIAKPKNAYGPVTSGETLWEIAAEIRPDSSVSIIQLAYSIYALNPDSFIANNMNLVKKGVYLKMPTKSKVLGMTHQQAMVIYEGHTQALRNLRVSAKGLNQAKVKHKKYRKQVARLEKKLGKLRHKSRAWNKVYRQLVSRKKQSAKWGKEVKSLSGALLAKATDTSGSPPTSPAASANPVTTDSPASEKLTAMNQRIIKLEGMVKNQATLEQRFSVLEKELGKKDKIILKLRSTLRVAATAMKKQQLENKAMRAQLKELGATTKTSKPRLELQTINSDTSSSDSVDQAKTTTDKTVKGADKTPTATQLALAASGKKSTATLTPVTPTTPVVDKANINKNDIKKPAPKENITASASTSTSTTTKTKSAQALSRDEKRRLRMAKANQGSGSSVLSLGFWKEFINEHLLLISALFGSLMVLFGSLMMLNNRRKKNKQLKQKAKALANKHNTQIPANLKLTGKLSNIKTADDNVTSFKPKKTA